ncbi:MAG: relaxase MobL [Acidobacteria bacterium]|nr:relaxase MobL [Acidobacteriota bacterium]
MRAVVSVKRSGEKGVSYLARYISESKLNPEREGERPRPLFTNKGDDNLTYRGANRFLTCSEGDPLKKDLIHFSVSFQNEDFETLGATDKERKERLREAAREAMDELMGDLHLSDWRWVAGIHLNTNHPHIHLLVYKEIIDRDKGEPRRLGRIPKRLLPRLERTADGGTQPVEGVVGRRFVETLDRAQERVRDAGREREGVAMMRIDGRVELVKALDEGELAPSPQLKELLAELNSCRSEREIINYEASIYEVSLSDKNTSNPDKPNLRGMYESLLPYERDYLIEEIAGRTRVIARQQPSDEALLLEAAKANPSLAGRELVLDIILRSRESEPGDPSEVLYDMRAAFKDRPLDDPWYETRQGKADWLSKHSRELRDLYEHGATIRENILVIPAEGHELNSLTADRKPFINELSYAYREICDPRKAYQFYNLAKAIAGRTANTKAEIDYFRYFYDQIKHDGEGRYLDYKQQEAREEALDRTLVKMRLLAGEMEKLETIHSVEAHKADATVSREQVREAQLAAPYTDEDQGYMPEPEDIGADFGELEGDSEEALLSNEHGDEYEIVIGSLVFNTASRNVNLKEESLRFPAGLTFEERKTLIELRLPVIDIKIETGRGRAAIFGDINRMIEDWNRDLPENMTEWQKENNKNQRIGTFLKAYVNERLKDPETRALNRSGVLSDAHNRITNSQTPEELNAAAQKILRENNLAWEERKLLFFGRAPAHHTVEMRELRYTWGLTRDQRAEYVKALYEGQRWPSPTLEKMLTELESRTSAKAISHYRASIINEEMRSPGKLNLHRMHERLPNYERDYLFQKIAEREKALAGKHPTLRETSPRLTDRTTASRASGAAPREIDSLREYTGSVKKIERQLLDEAVRQKAQGRSETDPLMTREDKLRIRAEACRHGWERLEPPQILTSDPAAHQLLSLNEAIERLREEIQPQARQAAQALDGFIRARNLDQFISGKTDYYYQSDQIPKEALDELTPSDHRQFKALEKHSVETLRELHRGFGMMDKLRAEIERSRNGHRETGERNGAAAYKGYLEDRNLNGMPDRKDRNLDSLPDRIVLGDAIIAHALRDCAVLDYEIARDHGKTFRFEIQDASVGRHRRISALDVQRRADAGGNRAANEQGAERADERREIRERVAEREIAFHSPTLNEHNKKLGSLVRELEDIAKTAQDAHRHAQDRAQGVINKTQERREQIPTPYIKREILVETQEKAISHQLTDHTEQLERLRIALAPEHGRRMRSDEDASRLAAQLFTARTELRAQEERAERFDQTRHLRPWEIKSERWSLAVLDRRIERLADDTKIIGRYELHIDTKARREASKESERLTMLREEVTGRIAERQAELRDKVDEASKLDNVLTRIYEREKTLRARSGQTMPEPRFTRLELERAADNIETVRDAAALRELTEFEKRFNEYAGPNERFKPGEIWGRALARETMAEVFNRENNERLEGFQARSDVQPLLVETPDGRLLTQRLLDIQPRSAAEWALRPLVEPTANRELRGLVRSAHDQQHNRLIAELEKTGHYLDTAQEISCILAAERNLTPGKQLPSPEPVFTAKQAMELEIFAAALTDKGEREHYLSLARSETRDRFASHTHTPSPEPQFARENYERDAERGR